MAAECEKCGAQTRSQTTIGVLLALGAQNRERNAQTRREYTRAAAPMQTSVMSETNKYLEIIHNRTHIVTYFLRLVLHLIEH